MESKQGASLKQARWGVFQVLGPLNGLRRGLECQNQALLVETQLGNAFWGRSGHFWPKFCLYPARLSKVERSARDRAVVASQVLVWRTSFGPGSQISGEKSWNLQIWRVFQKSNNYKIIVLRYGCLCVFIHLWACWGQTKQNWRLLCKYQLKKISSLNSWCNLFFKKVLIINKYSCLKIKNVTFNSLMSNL